MNDIAKFYWLVKSMQDNETKRDIAKETLKVVYEQLVPMCPHSEAIQHRFNSGGTCRVCKICGIEDHESVGGDPGDEYNYGDEGYPDPAFWGTADVEKTNDEKYFWTFRKQHGWRVKGRKAKKGYL